MTEAASVETTENVAVQKVELVAESFSVFTIKWVTNDGRLFVQVVNSSGIDIGTDGDYEFKSSDYGNSQWKDIPVSTIAERIKNECNITLDFNKAVYIKNGNEFTFSAQEVHALYYDSNGFKYANRENYTGQDGWSSVGGGTIYFIFGDDPEIETPEYDPVTTTVSTKDKGIKINLFDYQVGPNGQEQVDLSDRNDDGLTQGINEGKTLKFVSSKGSNNKNINIWQEGSSGHINENVVLPNLSDGYPILNYQKPGGSSQSLDYLFNTDSPENTKSVYEDLDYLFQKDKDGYYIYDSNAYYAYLEKSEGIFTAVDRDNIGFYPFTEPVYTKDQMKQASDEAVLGYTGVNHYFGMTISAGFLQPAGGVIQQEDDGTSGTTTSTPMIFEFSGDDDVWVFIDDVLVLDLGGIHAAVSGKIDFSTGEVWTKDIGDSTYQRDGTILEKFKEAEKEGTQEFSGDTFANYTNHTIKFFYLERGNSESNCMIKFNMPTVPENSVSVAKEVVNGQGSSVNYAQDIDFQFNIKKNGSDYANQSYTLFQGSQEIDSNLTTNSFGNFTLKHGQVAVFEGFLATDDYQVTETGAYLNGYKVEYNGKEINVEGEGSEQTIYSATTGSLLAGIYKSVNFKNSVENTATLNIAKKFTDPDNTDTTKEFKIQVLFQGIPYAEKQYSVGGRIDYTDGNGMISIKADETASISGLPYGTAFEIQEQLDGSYLPAYTVTGDAYDIVVPIDENGANSVSGKITGDGSAGAATVTVSNEKIIVDSGTTSLTVTKTWETGTDGIRPDSINVTLYEDKNNNGIKDEGDVKFESESITNPVQLTGNNWTYTWVNLPADTNFVVEESPVQEGDLDGFSAEYEQESSFEFQKLGRLTSCKNKEYDLGQNNMLLVKLTGGEGYILWTPIDLGLGSNEIQEIATAINEMQLEGAGSLDASTESINVHYVYGETDSDYMTGVGLSKLSNGWHLEFSGSPAWAQFWTLQYDRTINAGITNTPDMTKKINILVNKRWNVEPSDSLPESVTVQLYYRDVDNKEVPVLGKELIIMAGQDNNWAGVFENLDYYGQTEDGRYFIYDYFVKEVKIGDTDVDENGRADGFQSSVSGNMEDGFTITNTKAKPWQIIKVSASDGGTQLKLENAIFTLTKEGSEPYYGKSEAETGIIKWYTDENCNTELIGYIPDGEYSFQEIKAPEGYMKSTVIWNIYIENGSPESIKIGEQEVSGNMVNDILTYYFVNVALYELPSAGGPGIFLYMIGGTLLLMAGSLMIYINRRRGVLRR